MKLNCLLVDDEPIARKGMADYVAETDFLHLVGMCDGASQASEVLGKTEVHLILLDIQMPGKTGIEFLKSLPSPPMVIITTAYSEFALEGYALDVMDYLVKPISYERFLKAAIKARDFKQMKAKGREQQVPDYFFVKCDGKYERIVFDEILYVEAQQNYIMIHLRESKLMVYMTLSGIEEQLPKDRFLKVHKSFLVAMNKVDAIEGNEIIIFRSRVPISRSLRDGVMKRIIGDNLLSR